MSGRLSAPARAPPERPQCLRPGRSGPRGPGRPATRPSIANAAAARQRVRAAPAMASRRRSLGDSALPVSSRSQSAKCPCYAHGDREGKKKAPLIYKESGASLQGGFTSGRRRDQRPLSNVGRWNSGGTATVTFVVCNTAVAKEIILKNPEAAMHTTHDTDRNLAIVEWLRHTTEAIAAASAAARFCDDRCKMPPRQGHGTAGPREGPRHLPTRAGNIRNRLWH
jgi:hypothetical protein